MKGKPAMRSDTKRRPLNIRVRGDLIDEAKAQGANLSRAFEEFLEQRLIAERQARWLRDNARAIEILNEDIAANGLWSDGLRMF
jgi:antitoxin CcdA